MALNGQNIAISSHPLCVRCSLSAQFRSHCGSSNPSTSKKASYTRPPRKKLTNVKEVIMLLSVHSWSHTVLTTHRYRSIVVIFSYAIVWWADSGASAACTAHPHSRAGTSRVPKICAGIPNGSFLCIGCKELGAMEME